MIMWTNSSVSHTRESHHIQHKPSILYIRWFKNFNCCENLFISDPFLKERALIKENITSHKLFMVIAAFGSADEMEDCLVRKGIWAMQALKHMYEVTLLVLTAPIKHNTFQSLSLKEEIPHGSKGKHNPRVVGKS